MAKARTHLKLGLFTLVAVASLLIAAFALGARSMRDEAVYRHMYFDESVQGLEIGSPVKYRGVALGTVSAIDLAPDRRHVHVVASLEVGSMRRLGLVSPRDNPSELVFPSTLRAQLGTQGITGVKFINFDFVAGTAGAGQSFSFEVAEGTIAVAPSLFKTLEDTALGSLDDLPAISSTTLATLKQVDQITADLNREQLPLRVAKALDGVNGAITDLRLVIKDVDRAKLPAKLATALDSLTKALAKLEAVVSGLEGKDGLITSARRATDALGDVGIGVGASTGELERTLRDIGEAAQAIKDLSLTLERDPDMLLKGSSPANEQ
jgi:phospholipid/cholesterol/gamma-HCH transport system substrate-binding protein